MSFATCPADAERPEVNSRGRALNSHRDPGDLRALRDHRIASLAYPL